MNERTGGRAHERKSERTEEQMGGPAGWRTSPRAKPKAVERRAGVAPDLARLQIVPLGQAPALPPPAAFISLKVSETESGRVQICGKTQTTSRVFLTELNRHRHGGIDEAKVALQSAIAAGDATKESLLEIVRRLTYKLN